MEVRREVRRGGAHLQQLVGNIARCEAGDPQPPEALNIRNASQQFGELAAVRAPPPPHGRATPVSTQEHAAKDDLPMSGSNEVTGFTDDLLDRAGPNAAPRIGDHAKRAERIAPVLDLHKGPAAVVKPAYRAETPQTGHISLDGFGPARCDGGGRSAQAADARAC